MRKNANNKANQKRPISSKDKIATDQVYFRDTFICRVDCALHLYELKTAVLQVTFNTHKFVLDGNAKVVLSFNSLITNFFFFFHFRIDLIHRKRR